MILNNRYLNNGKAALKLSRNQREAVKSWQEEDLSTLYTNKCEVCGSSNFNTLSEKDRYGIAYKVVICEECGLTFANPYYDDKSLMKLYEYYFPRIYRNYNNSDSESLLSFKFNQQHKKGKVIYDFIADNWQSIQNSTIVEIGASSGGVLAYFRDKGNEVYGVDYGTDYLKFGLDRGINLFEGGIDKIIEKNIKADLIMYNDVLEHIQDIGNELAKIRTVLKENGCIFIRLPSIKNLEKNKRDFLLQLQNAHVYYFSLTTLTNIMQINGFEKVYGNERIMALFKKGQFRSDYQNDYNEIINYLNYMEKARRSWIYRTKIFLKETKKKITRRISSF